uniref:CCHC-type domain-containing protein n=1 Tax=Rhodosorus marinus TaxID=101924 RepID=A0A7S2ZL05_9RHOD|mmetsp:Transcript_23359/g.92886  ORF Transcript_23359/g.92886 Transcript_23359/m.92886 type:complete len:188 (+) Transcript_23359:245-808(+)
MLAGFVLVAVQKRNNAKSAKQKIHRCRFCRQVGHNVRSCPELKKVRPEGFYKQHCSICGTVGHNKRNCPQNIKCTVCSGTRRILCKACSGFGTASGLKKNVEDDTPMKSSPNSGPLGALYDSAPERQSDLEMRQRARRRVQQYMQLMHQISAENSELDYFVGGTARANDQCRVCVGKGYLRCLSCAA